MMSAFLFISTVSRTDNRLRYCVRGKVSGEETFIVYLVEKLKEINQKNSTIIYGAVSLLSLKDNLLILYKILRA